MHYLAPEQIGRRGTPPDPRSDLYAAGVIFLELLTGRPPVGKFALPSHVNAELPPLTDIVVLKCLEHDPSKRYPSATALLADLDRLEEAMRVRLLSHLRGISRLLGPPGSTRRTVLLAALALLLVALALAGFRIAARQLAAFLIAAAVGRPAGLPASSGPCRRATTACGLRAYRTFTLTSTDMPGRSWYRGS
jgi:hypothetical protein